MTDPLLQLKAFGDPNAGVQYVCALRRSEIEAAPYWDPLKGEAPLSPHQAVVAAQKYLQERYGPSLHLTSPTSMWLSKPADWNRGVERYQGNPVPDALWVYDIRFISDSRPLNITDFLNVMVLLNGKVIGPTQTRLK